MDSSFLYKQLDVLNTSPPTLRVIHADQTILRSEYAPHVHAGWELKRLESGELLLVPPGIPHETSAFCTMSLEAGNAGFSLIVDQQYLFVERPVGQWNSFLQELFALLVRIPESEKCLRMNLLRSIFETLRILLVQLESSPKISEDLYMRSLEYLKRNYYKRELSVEDIAGFAGVTPQYLNRLFRQRCGLSIRRQLIVIRLEKARELLESGLYLVSDAAQLTRWSCPFYFCNSFKRHYGIPPVSVRY